MDSLGPWSPTGCFDSWSCNLDETTGSAGGCHHLYPNTSICIASDLATSNYVTIHHPRHTYQLGQQKHVPPGAPLDFWCWIHEASMSQFVMTALKKNHSFLRAHFSAVFLGVFPPNSKLKLQVSSSSYLDSDHGWHVGGPLLGYAVSRRTTVFLWVVPGCCTMQLECPCKDAEDDSMAVEIRNHQFATYESWIRVMVPPDVWSMTIFLFALYTV